MTLNVTINTITIKFYVELFSPFFKHFTWQLKGKYNWQSLTVRISIMRNNFIKNLLITKSSTLRSAFLSVQASRPYSKIGTHLLSNNCSTTSCGNSANTAKYSVNIAMKGTSGMFCGYFKTLRTSKNHTKILHFLNPWQQNTRGRTNTRTSYIITRTNSYARRFLCIYY